MLLEDGLEGRINSGKTICWLAGRFVCEVRARYREGLNQTGRSTWVREGLAARLGDLVTWG